MEMSFLDALAMVSLGIGQAKKPFLQEGARYLSTCRPAGALYGYEGLAAYSCSFQKAKEMFCRPWVSQTPAMPSSPHR